MKLTAEFFKKLGEFATKIYCAVRAYFWDNAKAWRILFLLLILALLVGFFLGTGNLTITLRVGERTAVIGGQTVLLTGTPTIIGDRLYVPARSLFEAIGATIDYNPDTGQALLNIPKTIIRY